MVKALNVNREALIVGRSEAVFLRFTNNGKRITESTWVGRR